MTIKTYSLTPAARERLASFIRTHFKGRAACGIDDAALVEYSNHVAGACGTECAKCTPCAVSGRYLATWALDAANDSADNLAGCGHVELSRFETYSGHTELISFVASDYDVTEEDDGDA